MDYFSYMHEMMRWQTAHPEVPLINIYYEDVKKVRGFKREVRRTSLLLAKD